jgi:CP family cyanate transporter-like MFS transporter
MNSRSRAAAPLWLLLVSIVPLGLNLRAGVTSVPPLLPQMVRELPLTGFQASLLIALPPICFGVFAFASTPLRARLGDERALFVGLLALVAGLGLRALFPTSLLFVGTVIAGCGIGLLNVLLTSLIRHRALANVGRLLALNMLCLNLGASVAAALAVPIAQWSGSLGVALGVWALLGLVGVACWVPQLTRPRAEPRRPGEGLGAFRVARQPLAWALALFMGLQSLAYYATLSWAPTLLQSRGMSAVHAGLLIAALGIVGLVTAVSAPLLTGRVGGQRLVVIGGFLLEAVGFSGLVVAPLALAPVCAVLLALGQGGLLPLALYFLIVRAADTPTAAGLSAMGQGVGYLVASAGAFVIGQLHDATGNWLVPLAAFLVVIAAGITCGLMGATERQVPSISTHREGLGGG